MLLSVKFRRKRVFIPSMGGFILILSSISLSFSFSSLSLLSSSLHSKGGGKGDKRRGGEFSCECGFSIKFIPWGRPTNRSFSGSLTFSTVPWLSEEFWEL